MGKWPMRGDLGKISRDHIEWQGRRETMLLFINYTADSHKLTGLLCGHPKYFLLNLFAQ